MASPSDASTSHNPRRLQDYLYLPPPLRNNRNAIIILIPFIVRPCVLCILLPNPLSPPAVPYRTSLDPSTARLLPPNRHNININNQASFVPPWLPRAVPPVILSYNSTNPWCSHPICQPKFRRAPHQLQQTNACWLWVSVLKRESPNHH